MFLIIFLCILAAGAAHASASGPRTTRRFAELMLVYSLVGYFGILMLTVAVYTLVAPARFAASHGWTLSDGNPFAQFSGVAYGAMAVSAILAVWHRDRYLIAPTVCWAIFFLGATWVHVADYAHRGREVSLSLCWNVFANHGLMSVVLIALLVAYLRSPGQSQVEPARAG